MLLDIAVQRIETLWPSLADVIYVPHTAAEYENLVEVLNRLLDIAKSDESHPLVSVIQVVGVLIDNYETEHFPEVEARLPR